jgi:prepilin-type N-terminal cleavage/methylation domain-containing protein
VRTCRKQRLPGFSLIELLIATVILSALVVLLGSLLSTVGRAWTRGEQQTSEFQDGRAVLELIGRELAQAVISPNVQFIHDPSLSGIPQRANSDCIFWAAPTNSTVAGSLAEVGYYLSENYTNNSGADVFQLKRFFVPPNDATNYQIFTSPNQPSDTGAPWVSNFITNQNLSTTVANGVLAFWARCLDRNGDPIPWPPAGANAGGRFNSAAHFQPATAYPGPTASPSPAFKYTNAATTARANVLPTTVELAIVTLDPKTFARNPNIPPLPSQNSPDDFSNVRDTFNQQLVTNNIKTARTFTTRVRLLNGNQ